MTWGLDVPYEEPEVLDGLAPVLRRMADLLGAEGAGAVSAVHLSLTREGIRLTLDGRPPIDADRTVEANEAAGLIRAAFETNARLLSERRDAEMRARPPSEILTHVIVPTSTGLQAPMRVLRLQAVGKARDAAVGAIFDAGLETLKGDGGFTPTPPARDATPEQVYLSSDRYQMLAGLRIKGGKGEALRQVLEAGYARMSAEGHPLIPQVRQPSPKASPRSGSRPSRTRPPSAARA